MRAIILVTTEVGAVRDVQERLVAAGMGEVIAVAGTYDLVVLLEAPDLRQVGRAVLDVIQRAPGVTDTVTLLPLD